MVKRKPEDMAKSVHQRLINLARKEGVEPNVILTRHTDPIHFGAYDGAVRCLNKLGRGKEAVQFYDMKLDVQRQTRRQ